MKNQINFVASTNDAGERLDKFLGAQAEIGTRSRAESLIDRGMVFVNGKPAKTSTRLQNSDLILVELPEPETQSLLRPLDLALDILFEDDSLMIINKPPGLVVHPAAGHVDDTLVNALVSKSDWFMKFGEQRPGIVHRLDKDTSGILVVAKDDRTQLVLVEKFKARDIRRTYQAAIWSPQPLPSTLTIKSFLARHPTDRKRYASVRDRERRIVRDENTAPQHGKWAVTHAEVLQRTSEGLSLLQLRLETGRTHQIRVHLAEAGAAILADPLYGRPASSFRSLSSATREIVLSLPRLCLHAMELGFRHPHTNEELLFHTDWPNDLAPLLRTLGLPEKTK